MYDQQLNLLKYILNLPFESNLSLVHVSVNEMSAPELTGVSKDLNEFKILYSQKDITKKQIKVINQGYIPSLSLVSQLSYTNYTDHIDNYFHSNISNRLNKWYNSLYWGVSLNIPIFDGFSKQLNRKKANSDYFKVETQIEDTEKKMQIDYDNKIKDWLNNYRNYTKQKDNYLLAEDVYKVTADRYKEGIVSMTELLQDEMRLTDAQNNFINAHYNCRIIKLQLLKLTGKLDKLSNK
jgi:outer membrane protein TolC